MYIDWTTLLVKFSSKTNKRNITTNIFIWYLFSVFVDFTHSCHHRLRKSNFILEKKDFGQSIWPASDQLTSSFTILNCLEHEFLKGFVVYGRQKSFWKFSILSNTLDLQWCLLDKWKKFIHNCPPCLLAEKAKMACSVASSLPRRRS